MTNKLIPKFQQGIAPLSELSRVSKELDLIPKINELKNVSCYYDYTVYAHYFFGGCDWFVLAIDEANQAFYGFAILNQDYEMSELGYMSIEQLTNTKMIELDFHWTSVTLEKALLNTQENYYKGLIEDFREFLEIQKKMKND